MDTHLEGSGEPVARIRRAFRRTMVWQAVVSVLLAIVAGLAAGRHGFQSAMMGGGIGIAGLLVFGLVSRQRPGASDRVVRTALRAEAAKVLVMVALLWLAFVAYRDMVELAFLGAFMVSVLLSGLAFAVSGDQQNSSRV